MKCVVCEKPFTKVTSWQKYCSGACNQLAYRGRCTKEYNNEISKRYRNSTKGRDTYYRKKYGIGIEDYNRMFAEQEGCCAICGKHQTEEEKRLSVDHCHETGAVRGLLCRKCNTGLGVFRDDPALLTIAIAYLQQENKNEQ